MSRDYKWYDHVLIKVDRCLQTLHATVTASAQRSNPAQEQEETSFLSSSDKKKSAALMRINHAGEICAQALYLGQSLTARDPHLSLSFKQASQEEVDHLAWCAQRLNELNSHRSYLNPLWFVGSFAIGTFAGLVGDKWSLGFLAETEEQVYTHLGRHLDKLPPQDSKSRAIVKQMQIDEKQHATTATQLGAAPLPIPIKMAMRMASTVMTTVTYYV